MRISFPSFVYPVVERALEAKYLITPQFITGIMRGEAKGFRPEDVDKFLKEYARSIAFSKGFPAADAFNTFEKNRETYLKFDSFKYDDKEIAGLDNLNLGKSVQQATINARDEFDKAAAKIEQIALDAAAENKPRAILHELMKCRNQSLQALANQNKMDLNEFTGIKETLKKSLTEAHGNNSEAIIEEMEAHLKKRQKEELNAFKKIIDERIRTLHNELNIEVARISFLATQKQFIDALQKEKERNIPSVSLTGSKDDTGGKALLKGIRVEDVANLVTQTGRSIQKTDDGHYAMSLPRRFWLGYYAGDRVRKDMQSLATAIRATGANGIEMTVNSADEKFAQKLGRQAYEACRAAGFPPEDIRIRVNGKIRTNPTPEEKKEQQKEKASDLFAGHQKNKARIEEQAKKKEEKIDELSSLGSFKPYKDDLKAIINEQQQREKEKVQQEPQETKKQGTTPTA